MSEEKHTPLPWKVETIRSYTNGEPVELSIQGEDAEIALIEVDDEIEAAHANAELIVHSVNALPALVKALEEALLQLEYMQERHGYATGETVIARTKATLALVRGAK